MEKVNVMKKIALFMMVVALAVVFTACQGAVGKAGDDGTAGDPGTQGPQGPPGPQGFSELVPRENVMPLWVNDGLRVRDKSTIGTSLIGPDGAAIPLPAIIDPAAFFYGGTDMVKYSLIPFDYDEDGTALEAKIDPMSVFTVSQGADGMLTIATRKAADAHSTGADGSDDAHWGRGTEVTILARDSVTNRKEQKRISIRRNNEPNTNRDGDGALIEATVTVGEQVGFPTGATAAHEMDPCNAINVVCYNVVDPLGNGDDTETNDDDRWFDDWHPQYLAYTPTPTAASAGFVSAVMGVDYNDANIDDNPAYLLMVTGLKAGVDANGKAIVKKTEIEVIATDRGGLSTKAGEEAVLVVNVDPRPRVKAGLTASPTAISLPVTAATPVLPDVTRFFEDNVTLTNFSAKIKTNELGAIREPTAGEASSLLSGNNLMVYGLNPGTAVIAITASEPSPVDSSMMLDDNPNDPNDLKLGQFVTLDVTVTVK